MATVTSDIRVEVTDEIAKDAALSTAEALASDYFIERHRSGPPLDEPGELTLSWTINRSRTKLTATFTERDRDGERVSEYEFPVSDLLDPVNRLIAMLRLWGNVLRARSVANQKRIGDLLREMEAEENGSVNR